MGPAPAAVEPVVAERRPATRSATIGSSVPRSRGKPADLEDVGRVVGRAREDLDRLVVLGEVDDPDPLLERVAVDQALAGDARASGPAGSCPGRILSFGLRSSVGFVSWMTPR